MFEYIHHVAYVVSDMEEAIHLFRETFELELSDRRILEGKRRVEMVVFQCRSTLVELLRPINRPALEQFLEERGPGLHHVAFAMKDLPTRIDALKEKGVFINQPFVAGTGWNIGYFDFDKRDIPVLHGHYHGDHVAEAEPQHCP
jgi:methylmalonyl-CoA/ethylmalonyl-CoA epimerase